jgi:uncharacterized protein (TIGR02594 family)
MSTPPWMTEALTHKGIREEPGHKENNATILQFFDDVGHGWVKNDETPWCAAFVGACLEAVDKAGTGALNARSYLKWGKKVSKPEYGDVVIFWRGKKNSWQGHVAFFVKETDKYVYVLGGNQRNSVNVARYPKSRVLGYRRPSTMSGSRTVAGTGAAGVGAGGSTVVSTIQKTQETLMGIPLDWVQYICVGLTLAGLGLVLYARWDDMKNKGR